MSGSEVRSASSVSTPLPVSSPARAARSSLGAAPMPTTRTSAGISAPPDVMTMPGRNSTAFSPNRNSTPWARCRPAKTAPSSGPSWSVSAPDCGSSTVTAHSAVRAAAVVSRPIQPAPATTTRVPGWNAERSRSESAIVRR